MGSIEALSNAEETEFIENIRWELNSLSLDIKKESFRAWQELKDKVKSLWFYNWDENWENIRFNIGKVKEYLESIKDKSWSDLDVKSSELEKWVRTMAIQIAINYINMQNWESTNNIDWIDGIRGNKTWKWVKEFQTKYDLKNKDGLPWRETINKILSLLWSNNWETNNSETSSWEINNLENSDWEKDNWEINNLRTITWINTYLENIVKNLSKEIQKMKQRFNQENLNKKIDQNQEEAVMSWREYKYKNFSQEGFEKFILSESWQAIISYITKSHIDAGHKNENGEYDKFYEWYPISSKDLEIKLISAYEEELLKNYHTETWIIDEEKKEEMEKLYGISNQITWDIDNIVWKHMKSGNQNFNQDMIWEIELLLSKWIYGASFYELCSDQNYKDTFKRVLALKIEKYRAFLDNNIINLNTWDKQVDLQLKSYLYVYWRIFYSNIFKTNKNSDYYEEILPDIMKCILQNDDESLARTIKNKDLLKAEKKLEEELKIRDLKRRQEAAKRNRERNSHSYNGWNYWKRLDGWEINSKDINDATWVEIVERSGIDLSDIKYKWNIWETIINSWLAKQRAFWIARSNFKNSNNWIENIVTPENMRDLYSVENNDINENARKTFLGSDIMLWRSQEEINKIYNILKSFSGEFSKAIKVISSWAYMQEKISDKETKMHALWEIIDNIRDIFDIIIEKRQWDSEFEWFKFDNNNPAKREWNNIIMSGTFNWTDIRIRYDLNSWELFINSFLQTSPWIITIWNNTDSNIKVWELDSFDTILDKHYRTPDISLNWGIQARYIWNQNIPNQNPKINQWLAPSNLSENSHDNSTRIWSQSYYKPQASRIIDKHKKRIEDIKQKYEDMLYKKIDMIGDNIMENTKRQSAINSTVTKFMKTFNIITEWQETKTIEFNWWWEWSDLFDFLEIINNSDSDVLDKFQLFMKDLTEYSWLVWWNNNISWPQENLKYKNIFDENNMNENISLIKSCKDDFSNKFESLTGKLSFESGYKLWFAQIIKEKLTDKSITKPNWKLDETQMRRFFTDAWLNSPF